MGLPHAIRCGRQEEMNVQTERVARRRTTKRPARNIIATYIACSWKSGAPSVLPSTVPLDYLTIVHRGGLDRHQLVKTIQCQDEAAWMQQSRLIHAVAG